MRKQNYAPGEVSKRGKEIYENFIRAKVEKEHWGEYLVIDIETGKYEMEADHLTASKRAYEKNPEGIRFAMRIGFRAIGRIGFGLFKQNSVGM